jgi:uncharacterized protein involved in outer membrane biogenesis
MRWKMIAGGALLLVVLLVAGLYLFLATYDYNRLKPEIIRAVKAATGRELTLGGEIKLHIGLSPALAVKDVKFANAAWGSQPEMLTAERMEARVRLVPLLYRNVEVERIALEGVDLFLETDPTGRGNWEFEGMSGRRQTLGTGMHVDVSSVSMKKLDFAFRDGKTGSTTRITLAELEGAKGATADELTVGVKGAVNGQPAALSGKMGRIRNLIEGKTFPIGLTGEVSGAKLEVSGAIGDVPNLRGIDLKVRASGTNLAGVGQGLALALPETDAFTVTGHLRGSAEALALDDARGNLSRGSVELTINGTVGDMISLRDISLELVGSGKDLAELGRIIDVKLPRTGPFTVKGRLTGSPQALSLTEAQGSASRESLRLAAHGKVKDLLSFGGMDLQVTASGKNLAEFGQVIDVNLPRTGPFTVKGRLTGSPEALSLTEAQGSVSRESLRLAAHGKVKDLLSFGGMDLQVTGSGKNLAELGRIIDVKLPRTGPFTVKGRLTGSPKELSLTEAQGSVSRESLSVAATGKVEDLLSFKGVDLEVKATGKEFAEIGTLISTKLPELGSVDLSAHLTGSMTALALGDLSAVVGKTDLNGSGKVEFRKRPKITLMLASGLIDLTPLIGESKKEEKLGEKSERERRLFPDDPLPFRLLEKVDADIVLNARRVRVREAGLEFGRLALTLDESELAIDTLEAVYKGAKITGHAHFYPGSPPTITTKFLVQDFDLGGFLKETGASNEVEAHLDIEADLKSRGDSVHALMANLDGTAGAVMGKGYVSGYLDLLGMDLSRKVIPFWGKHKEAGRVKCGVVEFDVKHGLAMSQAFVFNTKLTILTGEGEINLATEEVNFLLSPEPKDPSLFSLATKLRVGGTIQDPTVRPDMTALVTKGIKSLSALVVGPLGLLAPFVNLGARQKHPCDIGGMEK